MPRFVTFLEFRCKFSRVRRLCVQGDIEICDGEIGGNICMEIEAHVSPFSDCRRVFIGQKTFDDGSTAVLQLASNIRCLRTLV